MKLKKIEKKRQKFFSIVLVLVIVLILYQLRLNQTPAIRFYKYMSITDLFFFTETRTNRTKSSKTVKNETQINVLVDSNCSRIKPSVYNDYKMRLLEEEQYKNDTQSQFFRARNYFHPAKLKIVVSPWNLCTNEHGKDLDLFVALFSRAGGLKSRNLIRRDIFNRTRFPSIQVAFILGMSAHASVNTEIIEENEKHGDIIQGEFVDSYRNLSFKSIMHWRWSKYNCMNARYFAKMDDDVFLNIPLLLEYLHNKTLFDPPRPSFSGHVMSSSPAIREKDCRYYVSEKEWPEPVFKPYVNGPFYVN
jgi:hypothetical protein